MPTNSLLNQLRSAGSRSKSGLLKSLIDLVKDERRIETVNAVKDSSGNLVYTLKMILLEDGEPKVQFPAVATISQSTPGVNDKINLNLKLPSKNYGEDQKMEDADTSSYQGVANSRSAIEQACWSCFEKFGYDMEKFSQWFGADEDKFNFDVKGKNVDKYIHKMSFIYTTDAGDETEVEFRMAAIPEQDSKETVSISFEYPNPATMKSDDLLAANNKYTGIPNKQDKIIRKVQDFLRSTYNVDSIEQMPESVVASSDVDYDSDSVIQEFTTKGGPVDPMKNMKLSFQKVKSSTGYDIRLTSIMANYDPQAALVDLDLIVKDNEFVKSLPVDSIASYEVQVDDDSLDIKPIETEEESLEEYYLNCRSAGLNAILDAAYILFLDNQFMSYSAAGPMMSEIQNYACNYGWKVQEIIDSASKMMLAEHLDHLENPARRIRRIDDSLLQPDFLPVFWKDYCIEMTRDIQRLVDAIRLYACNFSEDIQQTMQNWIRSWCYEIDYVLFRGEMENPIDNM